MVVSVLNTMEKTLLLGDLYPEITKKIMLQNSGIVKLGRYLWLGESYE